jgi:hypothetical protein
LLPLIRFFFELCLLRRAPQDLPASSVLLAMTLLADLVTGAIFAMAAGVSPFIGLAQSLVDTAFMLALLYGALYLMDRLPRFVQSTTALLGSGAMLGLIASVPLGLLPPGEEGRAGGILAPLFLALVLWSILVTGHILRHSFELRLGQGIGIAVLYNLFAYTLLGGLFSGA